MVVWAGGGVGGYGEAVEEEGGLGEGDVQEQELIGEAFGSVGGEVVGVVSEGWWEGGFEGCD